MLLYVGGMLRKQVIVTSSDAMTDVGESIVPGCWAVVVYVTVGASTVKVAKKGV